MPNPINEIDLIFGKYRMTKEYGDEIQSSEFVINNLLIACHILALIAMSGSGKTTIMLDCCKEIVRSGYRVKYVDADSPPDEHKRMYEMAKEGGFEILLPDATGGNSVELFLGDLRNALKNGANFSRYVFIFDTLKKFTALMAKGNTKEFMRLMKSLTTRGATVVLLGHANKHKEKDGTLMFEGVGDVRNDCDDMIYLYSHMTGDSLIVTTYPDKVRGIFNQISFEITKDREVNPLPKVIETKTKMLDGFDEVKQKRLQHIKDCIASGLTTRDDIVSYCQDQGMGYNTTVNLLKKYSDESNTLTCFAKKQEGQKHIYELFT